MLGAGLCVNLHQRLAQTIETNCELREYQLREPVPCMPQKTTWETFRSGYQNIPMDLVESNDVHRCHPARQLENMDGID